MRRLIFLNRFFFPDHSATSQLVSDLAFHLAAMGEQVHVVTGRQLYDHPGAQLREEEMVRGVHVHRVPSTRFGRAALPGRTIDYLSFYLSMWHCVSALAERGDVLVAMTDPPLTSVIAMRAAERRSAMLVNWMQDMFPEIAIELGIRLMRSPVSRPLVHLRDTSLKRAVANVVPGNRMAERLLSRGAAADRVHVIPNWTDDDRISPLPHQDNPFRRNWGLEGKFVVGYSGNLGRAHEFDTVLGAAERLRSNPEIMFILIGGGHQLDPLMHCVNERGLEQVFRFIPYQDRAALRYSLCAPDVHWISLRCELEGLIVPSKMYGIAAAGRPMIAITATDGEVAMLVRKYDCGFVIEPGDADGLARALLLLSADRERAAEMGLRARAMLDGAFSRRQSLQQWQAVLTLRTSDRMACHEMDGAADRA